MKFRLFWVWHLAFWIGFMLILGGIVFWVPLTVELPGKLPNGAYFYLELGAVLALGGLFLVTASYVHAVRELEVAARSPPNQSDQP
jgi:hypothetical protein